jgi:hypothetical protein
MALTCNNKATDELLAGVGVGLDAGWGPGLHLFHLACLPEGVECPERVEA